MDAVVQESQSFFAVREMDGSIVAAIEPDLLSSIYQQLITDKRKEDAELLLQTYSSKTGEMLDEAKNNLKFSGETISNARTEVWDENVFKYKALVHGQGWNQWVQPGEVAGTTGQNRPIYQFMLSTDPFSPPYERPAIRYKAHIAYKGWLQWQSWDGVAGQIDYMQAMQIYSQTPGYNVWYQAHVEQLGWMSWVSNGQTAGTVGQSKSLQAFKVRIYNY